MSKSAWSAWLGILVPLFIYGVLTSQASSYWESAAAGLLIGLLPLWVIDRVIRKREKKKS